LDALPEWTIYGGYTYPDVLYNNEALDSASISILSTTYVGGWPDVVSGNYYVHLRSSTFGNFTSAIGQVGQIPGSAATLLLDAASIYPPAVYYDGVYIPFVKLAPKGQYAFVRR
jgi:hypothetical protein